MHVRADHPFDGFTCHEAVKQAFPLRFGGIEVEASVDNGPTVAIFKQPQINVIEGPGMANRTHQTPERPQKARRPGAPACPTDTLARGIVHRHVAVT